MVSRFSEPFVDIKIPPIEVTQKHSILSVLQSGDRGREAPDRLHRVIINLDKIRTNRWNK